MSVSSYLLMPISKFEFQDSKKIKKLLDHLISLDFISFDTLTDVWCYENDEEQQLPYTSLLTFYQNLDQLNLENINFSISFSQYDLEYNKTKPKMRYFIQILQQHVANFCDQHQIDPIPDLFGSIQIGLISPDAEDECGEICGVALYCDGGSVYLMEEAGYLETLAESPEIYQFFQEIMQFFQEDLVLQFRG